MTVSERIREVGLLRAAGARRGQVMSFMLTQALVLGVVGSLARAASSGALLAVGDGGLRPDRRLGHPRAPGAPARRHRHRAPRRRRRDPRGRPRAGPPGQPDPAGRGAHGHGSTCPAARAARLRWLAVVFVVVAARRRRRPAARRRRRRRRPGPRRSTRSCSSPRCSSRSSCPPSPASPGRRSPLMLPVRGAPRPQLGRPRPEPDRADARRPDHRAGDDRRARWRRPARPRRGRRLDRRRRPGRPRRDLDPPDRRRGRGRRGPDRPPFRASPGSARSRPSTSPSTGRGPMRPRSSVPTWRPTAGCVFVAGDRDAALAALDAGGATIVPAGAGRAARPDGRRRPSRSRRPTAGASTCESSGIVERSIPGRTGEAMLIGWGDAADSLGVAGADVFAVRFAPDAPASARDALAGRRRPRSRSRSSRSTGSRAPSATRSAGSSGCSTRWPRSPS